MEIVHATRAEDIEELRQLFSEYFQWLDDQFHVDIRYQGIEEELRSLPGQYAPPAGRLLLVRDGALAAGCGALRPLENGYCEIKRMYLRPAWRGKGLGRFIAEHLLAEARTIGYQTVRLDSGSFLTNAIALYHRLGFQDTAPYYEVPAHLKDVLVFMELPTQP